MLAALALDVAIGVMGCAEPAPSNAGSAVDDLAGDVVGAAPLPSETARFGDGYLVWESNRSGAWRVWTRELDGSGLRRLSANEPGRQHCCPHISPDGAWVAYLSLEAGGDAYAKATDGGRLVLVRPDGSERTIAADDAHTYFENRAVVWHDNDELVYIGSGRKSVLLNLVSGEREELAGPPAEGYGRLIDRSRRVAVRGLAGFDVYDRATRTVRERSPLGGCQPYVSHDGRWGFWTAGAGGPLMRIDLATGDTGEILRKGDPRLPSDYGYLYFPMLSRDGLLFAFAASPGEHDHFRSDYEIFLAESDPESLEIIGSPVRYTFHPATDRFPDLYRQPLALQRHFAEAPFEVRLDGGGEGDWQWDLGDGTSRVGSAVTHLFAQPGSYQVVARAGEAELRGLVVVRPAQPPKALEARLTEGGREIVVRFDEPVAATSPRLELDSGAAISSWSLSEDRRRLRIDLAQPLSGADRLRLAGVHDLAQRPNSMLETSLPIDPPLWPSDHAGLTFLWQTGNAPNLIEDATGVSHAVVLERQGEARLDHAFAMRPHAGLFAASAAVAAPVVTAAKASNEISIEALITPGRAEGGAGSILLSGDRRRWNFGLSEVDGYLELALRVGGRGPEAYRRKRIVALTAERAHHVVLTYGTGRLTAYLDGELILASEEIQGDFYHWRPAGLTFGNDSAGRAAWTGTLEGVALYSRRLKASEVHENHLRYEALRRQRPVVEQVVVEARRLSRSPVPSLAEIAPYGEAMTVFEYELIDVLEGKAPGQRLRVAHWTLLDGRMRSVASAQPGEIVELRLELFASNPQLESVFLSDALPGDPPGGPLYYAVGL